MDSRRPRDDTDDRIEELVTACITRFEDDGPAAVEELLRQHPALAAQVRRRFAWLVRQGMVVRPDAPAGRTVLSMLLAKLPGDSTAGVHLDSDGPDGPPVRVTDEVRELRDPSGRYQFLGEIGRGGIGIVYRGRDTDIGRDVAMKVLKRGLRETPEVVERFVEEAQIGGQLQHPGIVPVYDVGVHGDERPYFAMKLIKGETLAALLARRADPAADLPRLLGVFEQICQTMAYAHARNVVHRDLKPANVMIGSFGEVQIVDWGLAKVLKTGGVDDEPAERTAERGIVSTIRTREGSGSGSVAGSVIGTPAYMAPEQARGAIEEVDARSDVFGLGAILCEILTGSPPYRDQDGDLLRRAAAGELEGARARLRGCGADRRLVTLCLSCLSPDPADRPASARELSERVTAYLVSVEERAQQAELRAAEARFRQRTTSIVAAAALVLLLGGGLTWTWARDVADARRREHEDRVAAAMDGASKSYVRAESEAANLERWERAEREAEQAVRFAARDDIGDELRARAAGLLASIRRDRGAAERDVVRARRDAAMVERLIAIGIPSDENVTAPSWPQREARRNDQDYLAAFADYLGGRALLEGSAEEVAAALADGEIEADLSVALDRWALVRDRAGVPSEDGLTARLRDLALRLDAGNGWRTRLRALLPDAATERERLETLADSADYTELSSGVVALLARALWVAGARERAVEVIERGRERHPRDFVLCFRLALFHELREEPRWADAAAALEVAHALRPDIDEVLHRLGIALENTGARARSVRVFELLVERDPDNPHWLFHLAGIHRAHGDLGRVVEVCRAALRLDPGSVLFRLGLANALAALGDRDGAIEAARRAVESDPEDARCHHDLAIYLRNAGQIDAAVDSVRRAVGLDERYAAAHLLLGTMLHRRRELGAAEASFRAAIACDPTLAAAHNNLGATLLDQDRLDEAEPCAREALRLDAKHATANLTLARILQRRGRLEDALTSAERAVTLAPRDLRGLNLLGVIRRDLGQIAAAEDAYRRAIATQPGYGPAHFNLALTLVLQGRLDDAAQRFDEATAVFGRQSGAFADRWQQEAARMAERVRAMIARQPTLEAILEGREPPREEADWDLAVSMAQLQERHADLVRATEALDRDPATGDWDRYVSACAAALAAADPRADLADGERARIRGLARAWLRRDLLGRLDDSGDAAEDLRRRLRLSLVDADLASVRGDALADLPEAEREEWEELWAAIERAGLDTGDASSSDGIGR